MGSAFRTNKSPGSTKHTWSWQEAVPSMSLNFYMSPSCHYLLVCAFVRQAETYPRPCTYPLMQNSSASFAVAAALGICGNDSLPLTISISGTSDNTNCTISQSLSDDGSVSCESEGYVRLWSNFYCFLPLPLPSSSFLGRSKHYHVLIPAIYRDHSSRTKCCGNCSILPRQVCWQSLAIAGKVNNTYSYRFASCCFSLLAIL